MCKVERFTYGDSRCVSSAYRNRSGLFVRSERMHSHPSALVSSIRPLANRRVASHGQAGGVVVLQVAHASQCLQSSVAAESVLEPWVFVIQSYLERASPFAPVARYR